MPMTTNDLATTLLANVHELIANTRAAEAKAAEMVQNLPSCEADLDGLLVELAEADRDCSDHFKRFESERGLAWELQSEECRADWSRCHNRREKAISLLTKFAHARQTQKAQAA